MELQIWSKMGPKTVKTQYKARVLRVPVLDNGRSRDRTYGHRCVRPLETKSNQILNSNSGPILVHAQVHAKVHTATPNFAIAKSILTLASAKQHIPVELLSMLADNVLADGRVRLAQAIQEGGDHALDRAIELAELLIRESEVNHTSVQGGDYAALRAS